MIADDPPVTVQAAPIEDTSDVIEVIRPRSDNTLDIDRRTYQISDNPHSSQKDAVQLLRVLPAVTIGPEDKILILGSGLSQLYVDGRPYLGDVSQFLRTLHGSDIERIEVITNPSARFSAEAGGGVINLVLRKAQNEGLSGNVSIQETSYAYGLIDTTLNYKRDDWAYQLKASGNVGAMVRRSYDGTRSVQREDGSAATINRESGRYSYDGTDGRLTAKATYSIDSKTSLTAQLTGGGGRDIAIDKVKYSAVTADFVPYSEHRRLNSIASFLTGELSIDHQGSRDGESLSSSMQFYTNPNVDDETMSRFSDGRRYLMTFRKPADSIDVKLDWKHPMGKGQVLSAGASWHIDALSQDYRFTSNDSASLGPDMSDAYDGRSSTVAAYATFQQTLGALTLAPGVRAEANSRRISSPSAEDVILDRTNLFPSFHANYKVAKTLEIGASFSKRIDRAPLEYLRPFSSVEDIYTVFEGNPALKDQATDAYELSFQYRPGKIEANATIYMRETSQLWSKRYLTNSAGASVYTYVNAGKSLNSGAQFDLGMPLLPRFKLQASVNVFDERTPVDLGDGPVEQHYFRYSTNGTLEWTGKDRDKALGDVAQLQWSYNSASRAFQLRNAAWFDVSASYTHSFNRTVSLSATFRYTGKEREHLTAPGIDEIYSRKRTPEFLLKLLKTL